VKKNIRKNIKSEERNMFDFKFRKLGIFLAEVSRRGSILRDFKGK
jgi:hypothetical protein